LSVRQQEAGVIVATVDPAAAVRQAWRQVCVVAGVAAAMALGIGLLAALLIGHALLPAGAIIDGLRRLAEGDHSQRLPSFRSAELSHIARAVNDLASRLAHVTAERVALTKRLFHVQEEERRALARDLHDEFGQCLTATAALAASIETGAGADRPDLADDARAIARVTGQMMTTLRGALARLRSQDLEEIGLQESLTKLVAGWNTRTAPGAVFHLDVAGNLAAVPGETAINVYRIAQECLTNAARHGKPRDVRLRIVAEDGEVVALTVEDDGGGDATRINAASGHGILGIRERIAALGGSLSIGRAARGVRVAAIIPLVSPRPEPLAVTAAAA
jgi:signal transduction histidine kinase